MLHKDIIRLYEEGIKNKMHDNENVYYNHYLAGKSVCSFYYVKKLYKIITHKQLL